MQKDMVNHPDHYKGKNGYECIDVMYNVFGKQEVQSFCLLNAFKYLYRCEKKDKKDEDIQKAIWYLQKYLEFNKEQEKQDDPDEKELDESLKIFRSKMYAHQGK